MKTEILSECTKIGMLFLLLLTGLSVACDGASEAKVIATYPRREEAAGGPDVQSAHFELAVSDVEAAARQVAQLARRHEGYIFTFEAPKGTGHASVVAQMPVDQFPSFRRALPRLGTVIGERITEVVGGRPVIYTSVTVTVRSSRGPIAPYRVDGWNPADTFRAAFAVFARLFQAVVDGLIWIAVVAGPFALMLFGLATLVRRLRRSRSADAGTGDENGSS